MRILTTVMELVGIALITLALAAWDWHVGAIFAGIALVGVAFLLDRPTEKPADAADGKETP